MDYKAAVEAINPNTKVTHGEDYYGKDITQIIDTSRFSDENVLETSWGSEEDAWKSLWEKMERISKQQAIVDGALAKLTRQEIDALKYFPDLWKK